MASDGEYREAWGIMDNACILLQEKKDIRLQIHLEKQIKCNSKCFAV